LRQRGRMLLPLALTPDEGAPIRCSIAAAGRWCVARARHVDADVLTVLAVPALPADDRVQVVAHGVAVGMSVRTLAQRLHCSTRTMFRLVCRVRLADLSASRDYESGMAAQ